MSDKARPKNGGGDVGGGINGGDDDEDDPEEKKLLFDKKGKRVSLSRWKKGKKSLNQRRKQNEISVDSGCWGKRMVGGCYVCLKQPKTLDSPIESPTSDPNSSEFRFDMLRGLIEKNDFCSKDCNPHLDGKG